MSLESIGDDASDETDYHLPNDFPGPARRILRASDIPWQRHSWCPGNVSAASASKPDNDLLLQKGYCFAVHGTSMQVADFDAARDCPCGLGRLR